MIILCDIVILCDLIIVCIQSNIYCCQYIYFTFTFTPIYAPYIHQRIAGLNYR